MLLTGTFSRAVDDKLRIAIPKHFRDRFAKAAQRFLFVAPGTDGSLAIYPEETFSLLAQRLAKVSPTGQDVRAFSRLFFAQAQAVEIDGQGRIRIPPELGQLAAISKEAVLIGVQDHLELWDRNRWENYLKGKQPRYDEIAENAFQREST